MADQEPAGLKEQNEKVGGVGLLYDTTNIRRDSHKLVVVVVRTKLIRPFILLSLALCVLRLASTSA